ncbi:MAG: hypothetical protein DWQ07_02825 [Chloroflexi bacterium]|nr:MAG: hypothetical protein DWQ07_02825 [Chloroflexota bacterium]MBL1193566.1 hypothetical protein [Chloroflexota bacterium]NOH10857.1 hypothetical protein [Chloroflexota bacterium]
MARDSKSAERPRRLDRVQREQRWNQAVLYGTIGVVGLVVALLIIGVVLTNFVWPAQPIAIVGDTEISTDDYQKRVRYERQQLVGQYNQNVEFLQLLGGSNSEQIFNILQQIEFQLQPSIMSQTVIQGMIEEVIVEKEAAERGIEVTDQEVDDFLQTLFNYYPDGTPTPENTPTVIVTSTYSAQQLGLVTAIPTATEFLTPTALATADEGEATPEAEGEEAAETPADESGENEEEPVEEETIPTPTLAPSATPTVYSLEAYQENINTVFSSYEDQVDFGESDFRNLLRAQLLREKVLEAVTAEVEAVEEQVWARHILVEDEATALEVLERLEAGDDWNELAVELSQDESNKNDGGNLGWFNIDTMVEPFAEAAFALEIGEISEPVESAFGWHIIQALGHEDRKLTDAELAQRRNTEFSQWLIEQRDVIGVEIMDTLEARTPDEPGIVPIGNFQQPPGAVPVGP